MAKGKTVRKPKDGSGDRGFDDMVNALLRVPPKPAKLKKKPKTKRT